MSSRRALASAYTENCRLLSMQCRIMYAQVDRSRSSAVVGRFRIGSEHSANSLWILAKPASPTSVSSVFLSSQYSMACTRVWRNLRYSLRTTARNAPPFWISSAVMGFLLPLLGLGGHKPVQFGVFGEMILKRNDGIAVEQQALTFTGMGHMGQLMGGNTQLLG